MCFAGGSASPVGQRPVQSWTRCCRCYPRVCVCVCVCVCVRARARTREGVQTHTVGVGGGVGHVCDAD